MKTTIASDLQTEIKNVTTQLNKRIIASEIEANQTIQNVDNKQESWHQSTGELSQEDYGTGRGASFQCSNIFSIFAVLVFLFALVDFIMGMDGRRRRRREVSSCDATWIDLELPPGLHLEEPPGVQVREEVAREAQLAVALLWRGNLLSDIQSLDNIFDDTSFDSDSEARSSWKGKKRRKAGKRHIADGCAATIRCQAAKSAASLGRYGAALAFLVGESPDTCLEDPTCDQEVFPFWQGVEHKVNENSGYFRRTVEDINNSAFDTHQ